MTVLRDCMPDPKAPTHAAFALRRENRITSRWIEIGHAHIESTDKIHHVFLDRLPIGGFTGHVCIVPLGGEPPEPGPERPLGDGD